MKTTVHKNKRKAGLVREETFGYGGAIVLYQAADGKISLHVKIEKETIWLSLNQMAELFDRDKSVVSRHLRNIFDTSELDRHSTVAFFATVQNEGGRSVERQVEHFNLDAILSVGYRINSKRGSQFRIWATKVLRDHILKGFSVNERRLKELRQSIRLVGQVLDHNDISSDQAKSLLLVKNHSFVDGNKRIAAALFLWFMEKNRLLYRPDGIRQIANTTLVAVTLMIAESKPEQKELLTRLVANLLHDKD
jgi:hypothetical protein